MPIAAVPAYLGRDFKNASPGMRFGMYLALWGINLRTKEPLWKTHDLDYQVRGQDRQEREVKLETKVSALTEARKLHVNDKLTMASLLGRQKAAFDLSPTQEAKFAVDATATAPFTTGLGNEHPLENGFAFLNPYGLPYLPGSGVKGVLRQAARELASGDWGDSHGWGFDKQYLLQAGKQTTPLSAIDALFGLESGDGDTQHVRGALTFWDVIPQIKGDSLTVDIMTPHQGHYYQQKQEARTGNSTSPHDSGQPIPITFLTVPPGSGFTFHVQCDLEHLTKLAPPLAADNRWQILLQAAFDHAFAWLGFGAKTAVGYGHMSVDQQAQHKRAEAQKAREKAALSPCDRALDDIASMWEAEKALNRKQAGGPLDSLITEKVKAAVEWDVADRQKLAETCRDAMKWLGKDKKKIREKLAPLDLPPQ